MINSRLFIWAIISCLGLTVACGPDADIHNKDDVIETIYHYIPPVDFYDGLTVSDLESEELDDLPIRIMVDSINKGIYGLFHSLLIFRNNKLIFEEYFNGFSSTDLQPMWSVTKSISSALIGIAIDQGKISGTHETIYNLMNSQSQVNWTEDHKKITLEHYLTMSAGYKWRDQDNGVSANDSNNSYSQMIESDDWIKFVLELPIVVTPGTKFHYNNGTSSLFSVIVADAFGENFDVFTENNLLSKIEIEQYDWGYLDGGHPGTAGNNGGLFLTSRDMSKFGLLYLNDGNWNGDQVVSENWVSASLSPQIGIVKNDSLEFSYGYQWWRNERVKSKEGEISITYAVGHGGQYIFLIEDYDMIVVATAPYENPGRTTLGIFTMLEDYILSAVED